MTEPRTVADTSTYVQRIFGVAEHLDLRAQYLEALAMECGSSAAALCRLSAADYRAEAKALRALYEGPRE